MSTQLKEFFSSPYAFDENDTIRLWVKIPWN